MQCIVDTEHRMGASGLFRLRSRPIDAAISTIRNRRLAAARRGRDHLVRVLGCDLASDRNEDVRELVLVKDEDAAAAAQRFQPSALAKIDPGLLARSGPL
jgi:hypothetical protein